MLWVDEHRPRSLDKVDFHKSQSLQMKKLVRKTMYASPLLFLSNLARSVHTQLRD
jgi:hypothetical protein